MRPISFLAVISLAVSIPFAAPDGALGALDNFVKIEGGSFTMGSPSSERQRQVDEIQHQVTIATFYVDPYEVTQQDYEKLMKKNPSENKGKKRPVENVTWFDAIEYCNALSKEKGLTPAYTIAATTANGAATPDVIWDRSADGYRLLTEAEWEFAARAGTKTVFHFGNRIQSKNANFEGTYPYGIEDNYSKTRDNTVIQSSNRGETIEVGKLPANAFGLYDMHGNVSEWVFDWYAPYDIQQTANPVGPAKGTYRISRGGSWNDFGKHLRSAYRSAVNPMDPDENTGLRICRGALPEGGKITTTQVGSFKIPAKPRILIAYFSYTGNDKKAAHLIQKKLGGDNVEIVRKEPYRGEIYDVTGVEVVNGKYPEISTKIPDLSKYDVVILGFPTWWASMPMPVFTFVEKCNWQGKIILPFSSNGGTRFGDSVSDLIKLAKGAYVLPGYQFYYSGGWGIENKLMNWLRANGIRK